MPYLSVTNIDSLLKLLTLSSTLKYIHHLYYRSKYWPPGPRGLPILGNIPQLPSFPWFKFTEWKAQYGPVISLNLAGQPMIILNTHKAASDLLSKGETVTVNRPETLLDHHSQIYSDRPTFIMAGEIMTGGLNFALLPYDDLWRRMRKATHEAFNVRAAESYRPLQEMEAIHLVINLLRSPVNWDSHFKRSAASSVLCSIYGWDTVGSGGDAVIDNIINLGHRMARATLPGAHLVEIFPIMRYLPTWVAKWKREGLEWFTKDTKMLEELMFGVKERKLSGNCPPCFASSILENQSKNNFSNKESSWLAGSMFLAGSETSAAAMSAFLLAMVLNPDIMRTERVEIDDIIGRDRLPTFGDFDRLPYIQAVVKEALRWGTTTPLGVPRRTAQSDWYEEYYIPKGSLVVNDGIVVRPALFTCKIKPRWDDVVTVLEHAGAEKIF